MIPDFSKCHCDQPGFCKLYNKIMEEMPPNWQWCQNASSEKRKTHYEQTEKNRHKTKSIDLKYTLIEPFQYYDSIQPTKKLAICVIPADKKSEDQYQIIKDNIKNYADKCDADLVELFGDKNTNWPMANKYRLHNVLTKYEKTLYLDCDVFIKKDTPDIFKITPDDQISAFNEMEYFDEPKNKQWIIIQQSMVSSILLNNKSENKPGEMMLNCGVIVIPKTLANYYQQPSEPYPDFWCFDQHLLSLKLPKNKVCFLDKKWNLTYTARRSKYGFFNNIDNSYFVHINDSSPDFKVEMLKLLKYMDG